MAHALGLRVGKNYRWQGKIVSAWVGAMKINLDFKTQGSVKLSEVLPEILPEIPPELGDRFQGWYDQLTPPQQAVVDRIMEEWEGGGGDSEVHYNLEKSPVSPWSMAIGAKLEFSRNWQFRTEFNFLGDRTTIMANLVYRIDL